MPLLEHQLLLLELQLLTLELLLLLGRNGLRAQLALPQQQLLVLQLLLAKVLRIGGLLQKHLLLIDPHLLLVDLHLLRLDRLNRKGSRSQGERRKKNRGEPDSGAHQQ